MTQTVLRAEGIERTDDELGAAILGFSSASTARGSPTGSSWRPMPSTCWPSWSPPSSRPRQSVDRKPRVAGEDVPPLAPNVALTLRRLKDAGVRLGIVCDVGMVPSPLLRVALEHHGVIGLFDHWSFSDEVGVYKPSRDIFVHR